MSQGELFQHFAMLAWGKFDMHKVTLLFLKFHCTFSHSWAPLGCCNLSPGLQSSNEGMFLHGWLLN